MQVRSQALAGLILCLLPQTAFAWAEGPFCEVARPPLRLESDGDELGMCLLEPHLLRGTTVDACPPMSGRVTPDEAPVLAARALGKARELAAEGLYEEAWLNLRVVEATLPRIADHAAFMRAELHEQGGDFTRAASAYREVIDQSPSIDLRARGRVGYVRSLLRAGAERAEGELSALLARYPQLPEAPALRLELARHRELIGQRASAIAIYRAIDLSLPGYPMAAVARERLSLLANQGFVVAPYTEAELLDRMERLTRTGPLEQARAAALELRAVTFSKALSKRRDAVLQAFDEYEARRMASAADRPSELISPDPDFEQLRKKLAQPKGEKQLAKLRPGQLMAQLERAASLRLIEVSDALVLEFSRRLKSTSAELRFEALVKAIGGASDGAIVALADTLVADFRLAVPARYHRARALESAGRSEEAKAELGRVIELDHSPTRFYATWAEQRLRELARGTSECRASGVVGECNRAEIESSLAQLETMASVDTEQALLRLTAVEAMHAEAYPWLSRALDLVRIGELERATDELHEAYLAWRQVTRRGAIRAGREAVYRGTTITRSATDVTTLRARLALGFDARIELARVASALGDWGTAVNFGGLEFAEQNARPYAAEVARAARKHGLDPDLLFAVMRVESVYQRRIISHAGAIGLMQIMPKTGRLIADKLGHHEMTATDLLDPRTNIEFSAWYLSSLIRRMDGHLPLAIASYNGGPHNVRAWIRRCGAHVPLDAFLERIPFRETKRYVRRVLGYYTSYKAQRGQRLGLMATRLSTSDATQEVTF
jgi:soluble lytic murein transglycosylase